MNTRTAVLGAILIGATTPLLRGQSAALPRFEVASIKAVAKPDPNSVTGFVRVLPGGRLRAKDALIRTLIQNAYRIRRYQIEGGPDWINSARYDIEAAAEPGRNITAAQVSLMLQALMEERFDLKVHRETRELPVYELSVAKGGLKLQAPREGGCLASTPNAPSAAPPPGPPPAPAGPGGTPVCGAAVGSITPAGGRIYGGKIPMAALVSTLSNMLGRTVLDKTGYAGTFDIDLQFLLDQALDGLAPLGTPPVADGNGVTIFTALEETVGLKLDSNKGPVEILVIDRVVKPSEN